MSHTHVPEAVIADRSAGAVVASAAADALGAPFEFGPPLPSDLQVTMTGGGGFGWEPGEWTDDTQMGIALLTPLSDGCRRVADVEAGFLAWYDSRPRDVGNQTRFVLGMGAPLRKAAERYQARNPNAAGNGGLMRIGAAGLSYPGDARSIAAYALATTALTHPHVDSLDASVLWAVAIDHTIHNAPDAVTAWDFADAMRIGLSYIPADRRGRWESRIDEARANPASEFDNNGWVVHAFEAALSAIVHTPVPPGVAPCRHLQLTIEAAVHLGGDTDTVAAIAGSLLGARWGLTAVPLSWRAVLHGRRIYGEPMLRAADIEAMARLAARGGKADAIGWPSNERLIPYYKQNWPSTPHAVELGGATFGDIGGIDSAFASGADVVISLCRMGTHDIPKGVEHLVVGLIDTVPADNPNLASLLADVADLINERVQSGRSVYVHCVRAENRTPTVAATFLARHSGLTVDDALAAVRSAFGVTPNPFFVEGLRAASSLVT